MPTIAIAEEKYPIQSGAVVLKEQAGRLVQEIRNTVCVTDKVYEELYLYSLTRIAEFCQNMPTTQGVSESLLQHQMHQALLILSTIRGKLFPSNSLLEDSSKEEPKWVYAIFVYGLLHGLPERQLERQVSLYNLKNEPIGNYHPVFGHFIEGEKYFSFKWDSWFAIPDTALISNIIAHTVSPKAIRWLAKNETLFKQWWGALSEPTPDNLFVALTNKCLTESKLQTSIETAVVKEPVQKTNSVIQEAVPISKAKMDKNEEEATNLTTNSAESDVHPTSHQPDFEKILRILFTYLDNSSKLNSDDLFRTSEGLFLSTKLIETFGNHEANRWGTAEKIIHTIKPYLISQDDQHRFRYSPVAFDKHRIFEGVVLKKDWLPEKWKQISANQQFKLETKI